MGYSSSQLVAIVTFLLLFFNCGINRAIAQLNEEEDMTTVEFGSHKKEEVTDVYFQRALIPPFESTYDLNITGQHYEGTVGTKRSSVGPTVPYLWGMPTWLNYEHNFTHVRVLWENPLSSVTVSYDPGACIIHFTVEYPIASTSVVVHASAVPMLDA